MHTDNNKTICSTQSAHNMHTIFTQSAHTQTQNTAQNTEQTQYPDTEQPQHTCSAHNYRTYSFDFYHLQQYIEKLYNTAIYEYYTFWSPY